MSSTTPVHAGRRDEPAGNGRFAAFSTPNFRRYFIGQVISSIGTWAQSFAVTWTVLEMTGRSDRLGIAVALQFLPLLLLGAPAGVLADRVDNRRLLVGTSIVSMLVALAFGIVASTGHATLWWIYALTTLSGIVIAVERPAMQAMVFQLVGRDLLPSAVAANSTINSASRLVGPAFAGALVATSGIATCFYANAVSYVVVAVALVAIRPDRLVPRPRAGGSKGSLREALAHVRGPPRHPAAVARHGRRRHRGSELPDDLPVDGEVRFRRRSGCGRPCHERERHRVDPRGASTSPA